MTASLRDASQHITLPPEAQLLLPSRVSPLAAGTTTPRSPARTPLESNNAQSPRALAFPGRAASSARQAPVQPRMPDVYSCRNQLTLREIYVVALWCEAAWAQRESQSVTALLPRREPQKTTRFGGHSSVHRGMPSTSSCLWTRGLQRWVGAWDPQLCLHQRAGPAF